MFFVKLPRNTTSIRIKNKSEKNSQIAMNVCDVREEKQVWLLVQKGYLLVSKVVVALAKEFTGPPHKCA